MPNVNDIREMRAELQKMVAEAADDKAFGMFSPGLQKKITDTKKNLADLTVTVGKQRDAEKALAKEQDKRARDQAKALAEETKARKTTTVAALAGLAAYVKLTHSVNQLRQAGLENTVEATRQHMAYTLLGREVAGVFMPATTAATNATIAGAKAMSGLDGKGQSLVFVLSSAVTGLVAFKAAQLAATVAGLKFTGVLGGVIGNLGKIGLFGGLIGGLAAIFLSTDAGAKTLEATMGNLVKLANELGDALDDALNNKGKFWDDVRLGIAKKLEDWGILKEGKAKQFFDMVNVPNAQARGGLDQQRAKDKNKRNQPTPNNFQFEGVSDAFERVQIAAAKNSVLGKDPQLDVAEKQLEELKKMNARGEGLMKPMHPALRGFKFDF